MNKKTQDSPVKTSRKAIQQQLLGELKKITNRFGLESEKLIKEVQKGSKKLAKIISKELKLIKPVNPGTIIEDKIEKNILIPAPKEKSKTPVVPAKPTAVVTKKTVAKVAAKAPVQAKAIPAKKVLDKPEIKKDIKAS
ncbi:MAG TPA: hypothetical protein VIJ27_03180 [Mucilaginibacter sp.]